jgi:quinol-cytochrome oxidoreductase complex cytochrome b subunit
MVFYTPAPTVAYYNMLNILSNVNLASLCETVTALGAELMVISVTLHMIRVYFTGLTSIPANSPGLTGVVLLLVTLFLSFAVICYPGINWRCGR